MFKTYKSYLEAILFEFEQEKIYHDAFKIKSLIKYIPRAVVIYNNYNKYLFLINYLLFVPLWILWPILINPLLVLYFTIKWLFPVLKSSKISIPQNVYLLLSDIKFFSYLDSSEKNYPEAIINFPFHNAQSKFNTKLKSVNFFQITDFTQMISSIFLALLTPWLLLFSKKRYLMLFSYSSFYWYWTYNSFINKNINSIWLSNHYDRWLKLVDVLPNVNQKTMIQHGQMEYVETETNKIYFPVFTNKLQYINSIYVVDDYSKKYFLDMMSDKSTTEFFKIKSKLDVINWPTNFHLKVKILILGHQNDFTFHQALIHKLNQSNTFDIAYKTHPQQNLDFNLNDIWLVSISNQFPKSDYVISYGSSLDNEIKQLLPNTIIINYSFNDKFNEGEAINSIELQLNKLLQLEKSIN